MHTVNAPFTILFVLYPQFTQLDFAGPAEVFSCLPNVRMRYASPDGGELKGQPLLTYKGMEKLSDMEGCDMICVPGGMDQSSLDTPEMHVQLRRLADAASYVTSVCNGSLALARAGVLTGRRSACHWRLLHLLERYGAIPDPARVVRDGKFMSGGGVTAGIDFGLAVAAEIAGSTYAQAVQLSMQYSPEPPFGSGSPDTAPPEVVDAFDAAFGPAFERIR